MNFARGSLVGIFRNDFHHDSHKPGSLPALRVVGDEADGLTQARADVASAMGRVLGELVKDFGEDLLGAPREADDHRPARIHSSAMRASPAKSPRLACASPSATAASSAGTSHKRPCAGPRFRAQPPPGLPGLPRANARWPATFSARSNSCRHYTTRYRRRPTSASASPLNARSSRAPDWSSAGRRFRSSPSRPPSPRR